MSEEHGKKVKLKRSLTFMQKWGLWQKNGEARMPEARKSFSLSDIPKEVNYKNLMKELKSSGKITQRLESPQMRKKKDCKYDRNTLAEKQRQLSFRALPMIVSSLYDWLGQLRYSTESYDVSRKPAKDEMEEELEEEDSDFVKSERSVKEMRKLFEEMPAGAFKIPRIKGSRRLEPKASLTRSKMLGKSLDSIVNAVVDEDVDVILRRKRLSVDYSEHRKASTDTLIKAYDGVQDLQTISELPEKIGLVRRFLKRWKSNQNLLEPPPESPHKFKSCDALHVKHGELRPVSVMVEESVQEFEPPPPAAVRYKLDIPGSCVSFLQDIRYNCEEEQSHLESHQNIGVGSPKQPGDSFLHRKTIAPKTNTEKSFTNLSKVTLNGKSWKLSKSDELRIVDGRVILIQENGKKRTELMDCFYVRSQREPEKETVVLQDEQQRELKLTKQSERQSNQRSFLQLFLRRRVTQSELEVRGIYKNETIFGNTLVQLYENSKSPVPEFITRVIDLIELPKNIVSEGIYRTSGNTATIHSVRIKVDNSQLKVLQDHQNDPDVLAGSLKLFFRELKESIVSNKDYDEMKDILESSLSDEEKYEKVGDVIGRMHVAHRETLRVVMEHLLRVCGHIAENQMSVENMSVCWGPSIISFLEQSSDPINAARTKNRVVELILNAYAHSFAPGIARHSESSRSIQSVQSLQIKNIRRSTSESSVEKWSGSTPCLPTGNLIAEVFSLIEGKQPLEGVYEKAGNRKKVDKMYRKATKKTPSKQLKQTMNRRSTTAYDLADFIKDYVQTETNVKIDAAFLMNLESKPDTNEEVKSYVSSLICRNTLQQLFEHLNVVVKESKDKDTALYNVTKNWLFVLTGVGPTDSNFDRCRFAMEKVLLAFDSRPSYTRTNSLYAPRETSIAEYEPT